MVGHECGRSVLADGFAADAADAKKHASDATATADQRPLVCCTAP
jgi:hypothetical protein